MPFKEITFEPLQVDDSFDQYAIFANKAFGKHSYQVKKRYLCWLKGADFSSTAKKNECIVAVTPKHEIVGCMQTMYVDWSIRGEISSFVVPFNLMVLPEFRKGVGLSLVWQMLHGEENCFIAGTSDFLCKLYEKLGMCKVKTVLYRKILSPIRGAVDFAYFKVTGRCFAEPYFSGIDPKLAKLGNEGGVSFATSPSDEIITRITTLLNESIDDLQIAPYWNKEQVRWRFFHSLGPKHLLIYLRQGDQITDFVMLSLGPRHGVGVCRILALVAGTTEKLSILLQYSEVAAKHYGGDVLMHFCADKMLDEKLQTLGWQPVYSDICSYLKCGKNKFDADSVFFSSAIGDYGFEAIPLT